jgi:acyl-CoA thioesterase I
MRTRNHITICALILIMASTYVQAQQPKFMLDDGDKIVFLGDSITQGGAAPEGYVTLFKLFCGVNGYEVEVINAGISGHKSNDMLARLQRDVLDHKPSWVSISCGVNDVWHNFGRDRQGRQKQRGLPLNEYQKNMTEIIERCQNAGINILLLTATPIYEDTDNPENIELEKYNNALRQLAKEKKVVLCDLNKIFMSWYQKKANDENLLTTDGVHMNPRGNRMMTLFILRALNAPHNQIRAYTKRVELVNNMQPMP